MKAKRSVRKWTSHGVLHLESKTPLYRVWNAMKQRCDLPTGQSYKDYGGRGITYCRLWSEYVPFRDWALAHGYRQGLLLDRENNDGNYEPSNCRWITSIKSSMNRRTTKSTTADIAVMKSLSEFGVKNKIIAALYGITVDRLSDIREKAVWKRMDSLFSMVA